MLRAICEVKSLTPLTFNQKLATDKKGSNESWDEFENRTWRERCSINRDGNAYLDGIRFKKCIATGAQWLNLSIEGEGKAKYQKHFKGGVVVKNSIDLGVKLSELEHIKIWTSPKGQQSSKRWVIFPEFQEWKGELQIDVLDEKITEQIFKKVFDYAGLMIGVGAWRPENGGENGRFVCTDIAFEVI